MGGPDPMRRITGLAWHGFGLGLGFSRARALEPGHGGIDSSPQANQSDGCQGPCSSHRPTRPGDRYCLRPPRVRHETREVTRSASEPAPCTARARQKAGGGQVNRPPRGAGASGSSRVGRANLAPIALRYPSAPQDYEDRSRRELGHFEPARSPPDERSSAHRPRNFLSVGPGPRTGRAPADGVGAGIRRWRGTHRPLPAEWAARSRYRLVRSPPVNRSRLGRRPGFPPLLCRLLHPRRANSTLARHMRQTCVKPGEGVAAPRSLLRGRRRAPEGCSRRQVA
jgi:hypothetical protein